MKTYSLDLRERALAALDRMMPRKDALGIFRVSLATLKRWLKRRESPQLGGTQKGTQE